MDSSLIKEVRSLLLSPAGFAMDSVIAELMPGKIMRPYSSSVNTAVEYLVLPQSHYQLKNIQLEANGRWVHWCSLSNFDLDTWGEAWADTVPLAICRAFIVMNYSLKTDLYRASDYENTRD